MKNILKILVGIMLFILGMQIAQAAALDNYSTYPTKIFKCQQSDIYANYSNFADILTVTAVLQERNGTTTLVPMVNVVNGDWAGSYGNDNQTAWGNKSITFRATNLGGSYDNTTTAFIFVYSDECTGTNIQGYKNTTLRSGFGNYTQSLFTGEKNLMEFSLQPYLDYFGYAIYLLVLFTICGVLYIKNQSVMQPLMMGFIGLIGLITSGLVPAPFKNYILLFMGVAMAAIFWRLVKSS